MKRKIVLTTLLACAALFAASAAFAGHGMVYPDSRGVGHGAAKHHFTPPGHRRPSNRVRHYEYRYRYYRPPARVVRHSRVTYGHRHYRGCDHRGYRPAYYSREVRYYGAPHYPSYPDYRRAGWRDYDDDFGFFIYYEY